MSSDEAQLLARCRKGDSEAWDELFGRYYDPVARFVFQLGHQLTREDTEEICQEVFLSVIKNIHSFHGKSKFQTWVFRIAVNKARDFLEKQNAAKRGGGQVTISLQLETPDGGMLVDPASPAPTPDMTLIISERSGVLMKALEQLGDPCREVIELRYFGDQSYEEIAQSLELNPKTVSSRLSKCLDQLEDLVKTSFSKENITPFPV